MKLLVFLLVTCARSQYYDTSYHHPASYLPTRSRHPTVLHALNQPRFSVMSNLINSAGLSATLSGPGPFTLFAPDNNAFSKLSPSYFRKLKKQPETLLKILTGHVIPVKVVINQIEDEDKATTLHGSNVTFRENTGKKSINNGDITEGDIEAQNGVVHVINDVIKPSSSKNILETLKGCGSFTTLVELMEKAGLEETLSDTEVDFTIFAPTNEAFESLPEAVLNEWKQNTTQLRDILLNHVLPGSNFSPSLKDGGYVTSLNGNERITYKNQGKIREIDTARVSEPDIGTKNGVIHAVDRVLRNKPKCDPL